MTLPNTTQEDFWFRNDDGTLISATYMGSQNSDQSIEVDTVFRIRIIIEENNTKDDTWQPAIYAQKNGSGGYTAVTLTRSDGLQLVNDANSIADGAAISTVNFDLTWGGNADADGGEYDDGQSSVGCSSVTLNNSYIELEFCLWMDSGDATINNGDYWDLRVYDSGGTALDGYNRTPRVTASSPVTVSASNAALTLAGQQAKINVEKVILANTAQITAAGQQATISIEAPPVIILANTAQLTASGQQAKPRPDLMISANTAQLTASGQQAKPRPDLKVSANVAQLTASGQQAKPRPDLTILANVAQITASGQQATISITAAAVTILANTAQLTASGQQAAIVVTTQIEMRFRIQDADNYWQVTIDQFGNLDLDEVIAGSPTQRGTAAGVILAGDRIVIVCDDETIRVHDSLLRINYTSAANFKTETAGELETEGSGGAVSDIVTWPRTLSGAALKELNKYV